MKSVLTYLAYTAHLYRKNYVTLLENSFIINPCGGNTLRQTEWGLSAALTYTSVGITVAEFIVILVHQIALRGRTSCGRVWQHVMTIVKAKNQADYENLDIEEEEEETKQEIVVRVRPLRLTFGRDGEPVLQEEAETGT